MKTNKYLLLCVMILSSQLPAHAQDVFPKPLVSDRPLHNPDEILYGYPLREIPVTDTIPPLFRGMKDNKIADETRSLFYFFDKLQERKRPVRIVSIGDSHVRGHVFTYTTRLLLEKVFGEDAVIPDSISYRTSGIAVETGKPGLVFHIFGVNGATAASFRTEENIRLLADLKPDLIILSFGTNEAHNRYQSAVHTTQLDLLITALSEACPDVAFLLTTPPGAYKGRRKNRMVNPNTALAAKVITDYAEKQGLASWDLYNIVGGRQQAVANWNRIGAMRRDGIHFTPEGYQLQGMLLYQALMKVYNEYVATRME